MEEGRPHLRIRHRRSDYFPGYSLDPHAGYRPLKPVAVVLKILSGSKDDWALAYWFASDNSFLGGKRPQDLLAEHPERVIAAAEDELQRRAAWLSRRPSRRTQSEDPWLRNAHSSGRLR